MKRYKVDFGSVFIICISVMTFNVIWIELDKLPEAFHYGNVLYHIIADITYILNNLSIGVATAIIFYYALEFINKKKNYNVYIDLRADILFLFYSHLKVLAELKRFSEIHKRKRNVSGWYEYKDVPILLKQIREIYTEEEELKFKKELVCFFKNQSYGYVNKFLYSFQKEINTLKDKMNYRYFKESKDSIDTICNIYNDDFYNYVQLYTDDDPEIDKDECLLLIVDNYYDFLINTVDFYEELEKFIESIDKKKFKVFIKMLD